jgi:hypothetical protein
MFRGDASRMLSTRDFPSPYAPVWSGGLISRRPKPYKSTPSKEMELTPFASGILWRLLPNSGKPPNSSDLLFAIATGSLFQRRLITMSTNKACEIFEFQPAEWYYALEHDDAPEDAWDWREFSSTYGPFTSYDGAFEHLGANHANPGGHNIVGHSEIKGSRQKVYQKLVDDLISDTENDATPWFRY